ncbi:MAG TPA: bifunctional DNA-binding transcriptional regulator/O6-methylguanine-DNA methyltransferase Ada [Bryobacteraceae bacterium]|nr:bifunctional DNA-binding transcriptional regulator/O6-methylguanine-DNA methyltransferase Ada [Bryobacteraceae bacterium]
MNTAHPLMTTAEALTMMNASEPMPNHDEQEFWRAGYWDAVNGRDRSMDGVFYYAVRSTGVYCRPSCPSRRPKPENVVFFKTRTAAQQAGFRACKRCKPDSDTTGNPNSELVQKVCRYIDGHPDQPATLEMLSRAIGLSPFYLQRTFKAMTGITPRAYADSRRLQSLKAGLRQGHSVTRSMYDAGYGSSSRLYERASSQLGMTPSRYRKQGSGVTIRYTIAASDVGRMLLAATGKGICSVQFGDSDRALEVALRHEYPQADLVRSDRQLSTSVRAIRDRVRGHHAGPLPLDIRATAFQRLVWEQLQAIPFGVTKSYGEIAKSIGHPKAARAVARACATNPVAVAIPCHRVVRENGDLGGYRWGIKRKQKLLSLEQKS